MTIIINEFLIPVCNAKEGFRGFVLFFNNLSLCPIIDLFLEGAEVETRSHLRLNS